jgi:hypothetical protein
MAAAHVAVSRERRLVRFSTSSVRCHNERLKTAGLLLDDVDIGRVDATVNC